jgi:hypothetical protein
MYHTAQRHCVFVRNASFYKSAWLSPLFLKTPRLRHSQVGFTPLCTTCEDSTVNRNSCSPRGGGGSSKHPLLCLIMPYCKPSRYICNPRFLQAPWSHTHSCTKVRCRRDVRSSLLRNVTLRRLVTSYRRFGTPYRSHLQRCRSPRLGQLVETGKITFHLETQTQPDAQP